MTTTEYFEIVTGHTPTSIRFHSAPGVFRSREDATAFIELAEAARIKQIKVLAKAHPWIDKALKQPGYKDYLVVREVRLLGPEDVPSKQYLDATEKSN